jgi:hypothetical protein
MKTFLVTIIQHFKKKPTNSAADKFKEEYLFLKNEFNQAVKEMLIAEQHFLNAESDRTEIAIYQLKAAEAKVNLIHKDLKRLRQQQIA